MAAIVVMPQLGNSVESCIIMSWEVAVGDTVAVEQTLCSIETDKATMDVPSTEAGTILALLWAEGDEVPVKDPLVIVGEPGEDISALVPGGSTHEGDAASADAPTVEAASPVETTPAPGFATTASDGAISPRARTLASSSGVDASSITEGSGPHGRVIERDVQAVIAAGPALTHAAQATGGTAAAGTGIGGRVTTGDIASAGAAPAAQVSAPLAPVTAVTAPAADFPGATSTEPLKGIRKVVAQRMMASLAESAQFTLNSTAKADALLALRKKLKNSDESLGLSRVTLNDLVCFAVAKTLLKHPAFNAHLVDGKVTRFEQVHLGFAADTPRGLLVPVIRSAQALSLKHFAAEAKRLAAGAIDGSLAPEYLGGSTFTVSNVGSFGVETFTPVINRPEVCILGVGAITPRAKLEADGSVGIEQRINFSLTIDHQVIDGADGARFLKDLAAAIENIDVTVLA
ncbi:2-oxo acid dehydrogenase subunit E2 [Schaalia sp. 19OD2882]|uniref:dihydrolipoamide acetyltransferase family protein n=1 Tax=Schaalia sp. 19OD2882 TaxID=2794089 RepID=UPI001C1EC703|nr:dihydrolipoamide acetyltransferase family protein [Schaalia sp. 19OD2882]QWW19978.1 2-oxo acid dehydrogenase subunit E2 [Schaalia sp. 19OD2882]